MISRRKLLSNTMLAGGGALALAACTTAQVQNFQQKWDAIVQQVQAAVAAAAKIIPTIESVANVAASLFGPQWQAALAAGTAVVNSIASATAAAIAAAQKNPPATAALHSRLMTSSFAAPVVIGTTPEGVVVNGYKV